MSHRNTEALIHILEYFSKRPTRESGDPWEDFTKKREVVEYLEENMENPPSGSTLTRIFKQLESQNYLDRNTKYGLKHGRWYPTEKIKRLNQTSSPNNEPKNNSRDKDFDQELELLREVAEDFLSSVDIPAYEQSAWIVGFMNGIQGLEALRRADHDISDLDLDLELPGEPNNELETPGEPEDPDDIRNKEEIQMYVRDNPGPWECHFCSGYEEFYGLKNFLDHLEEDHDFIIHELDTLKDFEA